MKRISSLRSAFNGEQQTTPESLFDIGEEMFDDKGLVTDEAMNLIFDLYRQGERHVTRPAVVNPTRPFQAPSVPTPLEDPPLIVVKSYEDYIARDVNTAIWQKLLQLEAAERVLQLRKDGVTGPRFVVEALADPVIHAHLMELARRVVIEDPKRKKPFLINAFHSAATYVARRYDEVYGESDSGRQSYLYKVFQNGEMYFSGDRDQGKFGDTTIDELFVKHRNAILQ